MGRYYSVNQSVGGVCYLIFFIIYTILFSYINLPLLVDVIIGGPLAIILSYLSTGFFLRGIGFWKY